MENVKLTEKTQETELDRARKLLQRLSEYRHPYIEEKVSELSTLLNPILNEEFLLEFIEYKESKQESKQITREDIENQIKSLKSDMEKFKNQEADKQKEADLVEQDVLHAIEASDSNNFSKEYLFETLKYYRISRRNAKNNWNLVNKIHQKLNNMDTQFNDIIKNQSKWVYNPRVLKNIGQIKSE